jgi:hypothetical protein
MTLVANLGTSLPYFTAFMKSPLQSAVLSGAGYAIGSGTCVATAFLE